MDLKRAPSIIIGASLLFAAGAAAAQNLDDATDFGLPQFYGRQKNESVLDRQRPDLWATGILAGGFSLFPKLELDSVFTNNLLATHSDPVSDVGFVVAPSIQVQSNWGRHSLSAVASVQNETFVSHGSQDQTSWLLRSDGRLDVHGDSSITGGAYAQEAFEEPGGALTQNLATKPVPFQVDGVYVRGLYGADRLRAALDADFRYFSYTDVPQIGGGFIPESERNIDIVRLGGRVDYALDPDTAVFARVIYGSGTYLTGEPSLRRNYGEVRLLTGVNFDLTSLVRGEFGVGYIDHSYQQAAFRALSGVAVSAKVEYFPSQLLTFTLIGQRLVEDAAFSNASGYFDDDLSLQADYELRRDLILTAIASIELDQFAGISRSDTLTGLSLRGTYFLNRDVGFNTTLGFTDRTSSGPVDTRGPIYDEVRLTVGVVFQR